MTLSVKRIKNRFYVYDQRKRGGRVLTKYIGPLDRIIDLHQVVNYRERNEVIDNVLNTVPLEVVNSRGRVNYRKQNVVIDKVLNTILREVVNVNYPIQDEVIDSLVRMISRVVVNWWCGGWGSNPRRPTPSGPKPDPFDLARAPPHFFLAVPYIFDACCLIRIYFWLEVPFNLLSYVAVKYIREGVSPEEAKRRLLLIQDKTIIKCIDIDVSLLSNKIFL